MKNSLKNICLITSIDLPVPAVKGGAIETLIEYLLKENEKKKRYKFTVISIFDQEAQKKSKEYKHTNFIFIKTHKNSLSNVRIVIYKLLKFLGIYVSPTYEMREVFNKLKELPVQDLYIYEPGYISQILVFNKFIPQQKLMLHSHVDCLKNVATYLFQKYFIIAYALLILKRFEYQRENQCFSHFLAVSHYVGRRWIEATDCSSSKIRVLPNCVQIERFNKEMTSEDKCRLRNNLKIPMNDFIVIFAGRIVKEKGVKELI